MGPPQDVSKRSSLQAPLCRSGRRCCLLNGCGRFYRPLCARSRYCSEACQAAARRWQLWKAQRRYRASEQGRAKRREQARRWRARQREKQQAALNSSPNAAPDKACEGHHSRRWRRLGKKISCDRPGCYEGFEHSRRSPWQRFCSALCRQALRLVHLRDGHWQAVCFACSWNGWESSITAVRGP